MNTDDQTIFNSSGSKYDACLQNYMGFSQLAWYYLRTANALIEITFSDSSKLDVYVYAAVFLYRHSVELRLKDLIWMSNFILGKGKVFPKKHNLIELWQCLKNNATSLLNSDFPLSRDNVRYVEKTLKELTKYDPESDGFRYPFDKKMERTHPDVNHVDVRSLREQFNQIYECLGQITDKVVYLYDEAQSE